MDGLAAPSGSRREHSTREHSTREHSTRDSNEFHDVVDTHFVDVRAMNAATTQPHALFAASLAESTVFALASSTTAT
jgi:hypothetical protein